MKTDCIKIRLESLYKKISALESTLMYVSLDLENWINTENDGEKCIESVIYSQETIDGVSELLGDVKNDVMSLSENIEEKEDTDDIPDKI